MTTNDFIAELKGLIGDKTQGDEMDGRSQYLSQQIMKAAGLTGAYKVPLNAGRMRTLLKHIEGLDFAIKEIQMPEQPPPRPAGKNGNGAKPVAQEAEVQPRRKSEIDFVARRRYHAALRHRQRAIDNWWWREGMFRATLELCRCSMSADRAHNRIKVRSEGGRLDDMCPMWFWGRMRLAFPSIFPSVTDGGIDRFMESETRWRHVRPREESEFEESVA